MDDENEDDNQGYTEAQAVDTLYNDRAAGSS